MSDYPTSDPNAGWGYPTGAGNAPPGPPADNNGSTRLPMHFNGYSYVGSRPLPQPRRHFPASAQVMGNYFMNSQGNQTLVDSDASRFSPTTQWQMAGRSRDAYHPPAESNTSKQFHDNGAGGGQLVCLPDSQMQVQLCEKELWDQFSKAGTEMIVTKTGRRMFPGYRIKISGLNQEAKYCVMMDIVNVDDHRYKFQHGEWTIAGRGEPHLPQRFFLHPDSPASGAKWMSEIVSFHKVKLTNSVGRDVDGKIVLNSMHRYQPRIHIVRTNDASTVHLQRLCTFAFPQTVFITVTAYQNPEVTKLKIDNNPFAKGFREDGARAKKPRSSQGQNSEYEDAHFSGRKRQAFDFNFSPAQFQSPPSAAVANFSRHGFHQGPSMELPHPERDHSAQSHLQMQPIPFGVPPGDYNNCYKYNGSSVSGLQDFWKPDSYASNAYERQATPQSHLAPHASQIPYSAMLQSVPCSGADSECSSSSYSYYHPPPSAQPPKMDFGNLDQIASTPPNFGDIINKAQDAAGTTSVQSLSSSAASISYDNVGSSSQSLLLDNCSAREGAAEVIVFKGGGALLNTDSAAPQNLAKVDTTWHLSQELEDDSTPSEDHEEELDNPQQFRRDSDGDRVVEVNLPDSSRPNSDNT